MRCHRVRELRGCVHEWRGGVRDLRASTRELRGRGPCTVIAFARGEAAFARSVAAFANSVAALAGSVAAFDSSVTAFADGVPVVASNRGALADLPADAGAAVRRTTRSTSSCRRGGSELSCSSFIFSIETKCAPIEKTCEIGDPKSVFSGVCGSPGWRPTNKALKFQRVGSAAQQGSRRPGTFSVLLPLDLIRRCGDHDWGRVRPSIRGRPRNRGGCGALAGHDGSPFGFAPDEPRRPEGRGRAVKATRSVPAGACALRPGRPRVEKRRGGASPKGERRTTPAHVSERVHRRREFADALQRDLELEWGESSSLG